MALNTGQANDRVAEVNALIVPGPSGEIANDGFGAAFAKTQTRVYDPETDTIFDSATNTTYSVVDGQFVSDDGEALVPGWRASVGLENYERLVNDERHPQRLLPRPRVDDPVLAVLGRLCRSGSACCSRSCSTTSGCSAGSWYRSLIIIPYAIPSFMTALVWRGMLNQQFGVINRWLGLNLPWLDGQWLPYFSILLVNTWLGFPYMFLVCTGALQSIPSDLTEAASVDGAGGFKAFRLITFPLLLVAVGPLLVASFAFNFNNFNIIYLLTEGRPPVPGSDAGRTDILISYVYKIAFAGGGGVDYGFAAAVSLVDLPDRRPRSRRSASAPPAHSRRCDERRHADLRRPKPPAFEYNRPSMGKVFRTTGWRHVVAWIALAFALFPVLWVISAAFTDGNLSSQSMIPEDPSLDNFRAIMSDPGHPPFWSWFANSMFIGTTTAGAAPWRCAALASFAFSRLRFKGRRPGLLSLLLIQMFPNLLAVVALFLFMTRIKGLFPAIGLGSSWGLIFIYLGGALGVNTYLIKGFFDTIPFTLDEAAKIDGCSATSRSSTRSSCRWPRRCSR